MIEIKRAYVVRKAIPLKNSASLTGRTMIIVPFGTELIVLGERGEWLGVKWYRQHSKKKADTYIGYVRREWMSENRVQDLAKIPYTNRMRKPVTTSLIYGKNRKDGVIQPGETVEVFAWCRPYALTSKGWAAVNLVRREENAGGRDCLVWESVDSIDGIAMLYEQVARLAREDYRTANLRPGIRRWATSEGFKAIFGDVGGAFIKECARHAKR